MKYPIFIALIKQFIVKNFIILFSICYEWIFDKFWLNYENYEINKIKNIIQRKIKIKNKVFKNYMIVFNYDLIYI